MWAKPTKADLEEIPRLHETDGVPAGDKLIYLHFFAGGSDWYIAEYDGEDTFFGFVVIQGMEQFAEWGYISFRELKELKVGFIEVDTDKFWEVRKASEIDRISPLLV